MRRRTSLVAPITAAVLALAACGPADDERPSGQMTSPSLAAAEQAATPETAGEPAPQPPIAPSPRGTSERGRMIKEVGDRAGFTSTVTGERTVDFWLTAVRTDPGCTSGHARPPVNGHYLVLDFSVQTYPALADQPAPEFAVLPGDFAVLGDQDVMVDDLRGNSETCLDDAEVLPYSFGPDESAQGSLVLDVPFEHGTLIFVAGGGGWEWAY